MEVVTGVFKSRDNAEKAVSQLRSLGIPDQRIGIISPGSASADTIEKGVPVTDTEDPGMGRAMGATVGGAMGAAGGATAGLAVASLAVPGIGAELGLIVVHGINGGIVKPDKPGPWPGNMLFYILVDDLAAYRKKIVAAGGKIHVEEQKVPGMGKLSLFTDPDGRLRRTEEFGWLHGELTMVARSS